MEKVPTFAVADGHQLCETCYVPQPLSEFRRRAKGSNERVKECRSCHNRRETERLGRKRAAKQTAAIGSFVWSASRNQRDAGLDHLVRSMIGYFGGLAAFERAWQHELSQLGLRASSNRLMHFRAVLRLLEYRTASVAEATRALGGREDTLKLLRERLIDTIFEHPELLVCVLEAGGYTVIPPDCE